MLSSAILGSAIAQAALGVRIFSTADIGAENNAVAESGFGEAALAQIDAVAASNQPKEYDEAKQVATLAKKLNKSVNKPKVGIDLEKMGGSFSDEYGESYRERQRVVRDLDGNIVGRSGSGSASGSWNAQGSGSYENSRGSGSWDFSASMSYSVSFNHNWSPNSSTKTSVSPGTNPSVSPSPIRVNPCECCDCGPGAYKTPLLFQGKTDEVTIQPYLPPVNATLAQADSCATVTCDCAALADVCTAEWTE